ncbi:MAG: class I SAM-dependent methyltransferase [Paracoccaceae bacterium]|nr:class I SAM-dependent methyltransferase [Paracoccaceae bacterium]
MIFEKDTLERSNRIFWQSLLDHIRKDVQGRPVNTILDVGCHEGGLLEKLASTFHPLELIGIEPVIEFRERTRFRLRPLNPKARILPPENWFEVSERSVDLLTCHEVLHLLEDLTEFFVNIERVLCNYGSAFVVSGCHTDNPAWEYWSKQLRNSGQVVFNRTPFEIINQAIEAGLQCEFRPLRRDGWIIFDPEKSWSKFTSINTLIDHQYRNKLLFRLSRRV